GSNSRASAVRGFLLIRWTGSTVRRLLGVDRKRLSFLSRISAAAGKPGRVQRKIYEQSNGPAWRVMRHPRRPYPRKLPQFLPAGDALAVFRDPAGIVKALRRNASPQLADLGF